jgi:3-oxoadipate enol-lactonase
MQVHSSDADIYYEVLGSGPDVVLLHPFPAHHGIWIPVAEQLATRYRVILPDLRGHGRSGVGEGPATMDKHAADVARVCDDAGVSKAVFAGESIGGYILFEFWRRFRERISALVLCNTKAAADSGEARANRLSAADDVEKRGIEPFIDSMVPKLLGETTRRNRPDVVAAARGMMMEMSPAGIAAVQRGMAARPDSTATLPAIAVPMLIVAGDEDTLIPAAESESMRQRIPGSELKIMARAGHYAVFEHPVEATRLLRQFLEGCAAGHNRQ